MAGNPMKKRNGFSLVDSLITLGLLAALMAFIVPLFSFAWLRTDASELAYAFINQNQQIMEERLLEDASEGEDFPISFSPLEDGKELPEGFPNSLMGKKLTASSTDSHFDSLWEDFGEDFKDKLALFTFVGIPATEEE